MIVRHVGHGFMMVVVLLATPWVGATRSAGKHRHKALVEGHARFKASELQLRASDVERIESAMRTCRLSDQDTSHFNQWLQNGTWPAENQLTVGAVRLQPARPLKHMGILSQREDYILWHAWGSPNVHALQPQWLLFDVLDATSFNAPMDHRVFANNLKIAVDRSSWTVRLSDEALQVLLAAPCTDGRSCAESFQEWGVPPDQHEFVVFTSLHPLVVLIQRTKWHVLADVCRCAPDLLRRPRGCLLYSFCEVQSTQICLCNASFMP